MTLAKSALGALILAVVAILAVTLSGQADSKDDLDPATIAAGQALYDANCASCHGADLEGAPNWRQRDADGYLPAPPHDETGHTWHHPTEQLFRITKYGTEAVVGGSYRSNMPGFGESLSDAEIRAVLAFIKSTWPEAIIKRHTEMDALSN